MKTDNELEISLPILWFKSVKKWKYVLKKKPNEENKSKTKKEKESFLRQELDQTIDV